MKTTPFVFVIILFAVILVAITGSPAYSLPDLIITDISPSITCVADGSLSGSITVEVKNQGDQGSTNSFTIQVTDGTWTGNTTYNGTIGIGSTVSVDIDTASWVPTCNNCNPYNFNANVDLNNDVTEKNEGNNTYGPVSYTAPIPDLVVNSVVPSLNCVSDGNLQGTVTVNVGNIGCTGVSNAVVRLISDCGIVFSDQTVNLAAGVSANVIFNYTPNCTSCTCIFSAGIDPDNLICECSGTNNTMASAPYIINVPDITVPSDTLAITCNGAGQIQVTGTAALANNGCGMLSNATVPMRFTLYDNTGCTGNILDQWTETFAGVNIPSGGGTQIFTITPRTIDTDLCANSTGCQVSVRVEADYSNTICECSGANNTRCANKTVNIPDLEVQSDTLGVTCLTDGQVTVSGNIGLVNNGCGSNATANIPMRFSIYNNTNCGGTLISQWTQTFTGVNIPAGGGTQLFAITPRNITANMVTNSTNCQVSIRVEADYTNVICECDDTDNTWCANNKAVNIPNLQVSANGLGISCLADGQAAVSGTVTMANTGCGSNLTANIPVRFTLFDNTGCSGSQVAQWTETFAGVNIPSGGGTQVFTITPQNMTANLCANSMGCQVSIRTEADYSNTICESDGTDNTFCSNRTVNIPNLVVNSIDMYVSCNNDGNFTGITVSVSNDGCANASNVVVRLTSDCGLVFADQTTNLSPGETRDVFFPFTAGISNCTCDFTAVIDPGNTICECDGTDNTAFSLSGMIIPDIEVQGDTLTVSCAGDRQINVSGTVTLVNNGCGPNLTRDIPMRFTLYDTPGCSGSQINQWTQTFNGVNIPSAGGTQTFTVQNHVINADPVASSTNCQVSIFVEADYLDSICEWDGADNTYCAGSKNIHIPNLQILSDTLGIACLDDGQFTVSGTVTMANAGCGSSLNQNIPVRFTLFDNTGCSGTQVAQWIETFAGVNIPSGGGTQVFTITPQSMTANLCANSMGCQVSIRMEADYNNTICENDGTDNTRCSDKTSNIPDLRVNTVSPAVICNAAGSASGTVTVNVENIGCGDVAGAVVQLNSSCGSISFAHQTVNLAAGSNFDLTFNYTPNPSTGTCDFTATIDPGNAVCGCTGSNNSATFSNYVQDLDGDGIFNTCEQGPYGDNPSYDGNNDGMPDWQQGNVVSFHTADGSDYATIAAPNGTQFSGVQALPAPAPGTFSDLISFPYGLFRFTLSGGTPGGAVQVILILSGSASIDSYWKYGREPGNTTVHPYEFNLSGGTGARIMGNTVLLNFIDGLRGDDDLDGGNGTFVDDGGPVYTATGISAISKEGMIVSIILLFLFACLIIRRKRLLN